MQKFQIRKMTPQDLAFAIRLTDTMNWDLTEKDFRFMMTLEPQGCFTALTGAKRAGIAMAFHFGRIGWIGNVIVDKPFRSMGLGALLVTHAIDYLLKKSVATVGLYAYVDTVAFYEKLGFNVDSNFVRLVGQVSNAHLLAGQADSAKAMTESDLKDAIRLDKQCMGWNRERLLRRIFNESKDLCYIARDGSELLGFIVADWYRQEIGPCICTQRDSKVALSLFKAVLSGLAGVEVRVGVSELKQEIVKALMEIGFQEEFKVVRMYSGKVPEEQGCLLAMESLERG